MRMLVQVRRLPLVHQLSINTIYLTLSVLNLLLVIIFLLITAKNGHLFFLPPQVFRPYFFAGVGYVSYRSIEKKLISESYSGYTNYHTEKEEQTKGKFGVDAGFGIDYRISHKISIQVEAGYMVGFGDESPFKDCSAIKANLGICYNF